MISIEEARRRVASDLFALANRDAVAMRALAKSPEVDFSIVGFHAQQAVEKGLKAILALSGVVFPRTHNLNELHRLLAAANVNVPLSIEVLEQLTPYAVITRYDLERLDLIDLRSADSAVANVLEWVGNLLKD